MCSACRATQGDKGLLGAHPLAELRHPVYDVIAVTLYGANSFSACETFRVRLVEHENRGKLEKITQTTHRCHYSNYL